jgi:hypothetical protein
MIREVKKVKLRRFIAEYLSGFVYLLYSLRFKLLNFNNKPPVIILTPGKVGSSSIYYTLKKVLSNSIFHIHKISKSGIKRSQMTHMNSNRKSLPLHLIVSDLLRKKLNKYNGVINIITVVREPISREISSYFQNTEFYRNSVESKNLEINKVKSIEILNNIFKDNICLNLEDWFNIEILENFGVDVFSQSFNNEKGYIILNNGHYRILLLKMETMNQVFSNAIQEFLTLEKDVPLKNSNVGFNKHYAQQYKEIKSEFKISKTILSSIINSKYCNQFYKEEKIKIFEKWTLKSK